MTVPHSAGGGGIDGVAIDAADVARLAADLIAAPSPNPPGDVAETAAVAIAFLRDRGLPFRVIRPATGMWNIVSSIEGAGPGPRLMFSGHLDTFPFFVPPRPKGRSAATTRGFEGVERVVGRGAVDMKGGVAALLSAFAAVAEHSGRLHGSAGLCIVCDEETFGPHGARAAQRRWPGFAADAVLSGEPSGRGVIRHAERGFVWGTARFEGVQGHAAYGDPAANPIVRAGRFVDSLTEWITALVPASGDESNAAAYGRPTLNIGVIRGGEKINMKPASCEVEVDVRVPGGIEAAPLARAIAERAEVLGGRYRPTHVEDPSRSDTAHPLFAAMASAVRDVVGGEPVFELGLGATDGRLWRRMGAAVGVYGSDPTAQGTPGESVGVEELGEMARVHALSAIRFLGGGTDGAGGEG